jgi:ribosomal protein S18 acetylase RimI-like enzyme
MGEPIAEVTIRPTRTGDEPFVIALGERAFAIYSADSRGTMRAMLSDETAEAAIAEIDGAQVGFVVVSVDRHHAFGPWARPTIVRVDAIAVHPDWQERGVGAHLMQWVDTFAEARGACAISLNTAATNAPAKALFTASGYQVLVRLGAFYARGRRAIAMIKPLDPGPR